MRTGRGGVGRNGGRVEGVRKEAGVRPSAPKLKWSRRLV